MFEEIYKGDLADRIQCKKVRAKKSGEWLGGEGEMSSRPTFDGA